MGVVATHLDEDVIKKIFGAWVTGTLWWAKKVTLLYDLRIVNPQHK